MRQPPRSVSVAISAVKAYHTAMRATFWAALLLCTGCTVSCLAQFETAAVLGTVRDPSGSVIPNAKIALRNVNTGVSATARTDATGNFTLFFPALFDTVGTLVGLAQQAGMPKEGPVPNPQRARALLIGFPQSAVLVRGVARPSPPQGLRAATELLLQLGAGDSLLPPASRDQLPELVTAPELQLFRVHPFDANDQRNRSAVPHNDDAFPLCLADARFEIGLFENNLLHRISSASLC
jgi:hypothetical protein